MPRVEEGHSPAVRSSEESRTGARPFSPAQSPAGRAVRAGGRPQPPPLTRSPRTELAPLSYSQRGLWLLDRLQPGDPAYNIPASARLLGALDPDALERTLRE